MVIALLWLMYCVDKVKTDTHNNKNGKLKTADFFNTHPVFSLNEADRALDPASGRKGTIVRLKYHLKTGRLMLVTRRIYAVVPPGASVDTYQPDPFWVAMAIRPDGVFSYHSALELLGAAHSVWMRTTLFVMRRRKPLQLKNNDIRFLEHPGAMRSAAHRGLGVRRIEYRGKIVRSTGPERTLVEGFRRPAEVGGLLELVNSASGFSVLDFDLLQEILHCYNIANLWSATGWFLERFRNSFNVSEKVLQQLEQYSLRAPQYLERDRREGLLDSRWNLLVPKELINLREPDEH